MGDPYYSHGYRWVKALELWNIPYGLVGIAHGLLTHGQEGAHGQVAPHGQSPPTPTSEM